MIECRFKSLLYRSTLLPKAWRHWSQSITREGTAVSFDHESQLAGAAQRARIFQRWFARLEGSHWTFSMSADGFSLIDRSSAGGVRRYVAIDLR